MNMPIALSLASLLLIASLIGPGSRAERSGTVLFDDFNYASNQQMKKNGWILRTEPGWPGIPGATWSEDGVSLVKDPNQSNNWVVRMTSSTDGTKTTQTQICHQRKYLQGTYAARVRFS